MSSMREAGALTLPAGGTLALHPGGTHLMIMGIEEALKQGDTVAIVVQFGDGSRQQIDAPVLRNAPDR